MKRRVFLAQSGAVAAGVAVGPNAMANKRSGKTSDPIAPSVVIGWNQALNAAIAVNRLGPTVAARAISMVHESIYNAWAAYDWRALFSVPGLSKRPWWEADVQWQAIAVSHAAYAVLVDLFPVQQPNFALALANLTANLPVGQPQGITAAQVGQQAGQALLMQRHNDGANQLGNLNGGAAYSDWTGYQSVNGPDSVVDPTRWQPLRIQTSPTATPVVQTFLSPHWGQVRPFALPSGAALRPELGNPAPSMDEMTQLIKLSANLDDTDKATIDFFANNPGSITPPGQWTKITEMVSANDGNTLAQDVKLFFAVAQAALDASIACWEAKRFYDSVRPITAIRYYFNNQSILAWAGPGQGAQWILGQNWKPYQRPTNPSPAFPEFMSGHSTFSGAASTVLAGIRGDKIALNFIFPANSVPWDPTVPAAPVPLSWSSLSAVAKAAGFSRRLGGIHFERGDLAGRRLGRQVGNLVLDRCSWLFNDWDSFA